jgi:hypothetical protein
MSKPESILDNLWRRREKKRKGRGKSRKKGEAVTRAADRRLDVLELELVKVRLRCDKLQVGRLMKSSCRCGSVLESPAEARDYGAREEQVQGPNHCSPLN